MPPAAHQLTSVVVVREVVTASLRHAVPLAGRYAFRTALIACPECATEVSDRAASCPRCGAPVAHVVRVTAPAQTMLANPLVAVTWRGVVVAKLGRGQSVDVPVTVAGMLSCAAAGRSVDVRLTPGGPTRVMLSWSRLSGGLKATAY